MTEKIIIKDGRDIVLTRTPIGAHANIPQTIVCHSPTGFEWGYGGSGPADLALNVLALFVDKEYTQTLHQQYKWDVISKVPFEGGVILAKDVVAWIKAHAEEIL
jgi:hypothetical protein